MGEAWRGPLTEPQTTGPTPSFPVPRKPVARAEHGPHHKHGASWPPNSLRPGKMGCTPAEPHVKPLNSDNAGLRQRERGRDGVGANLPFAPGKIKRGFGVTVP